MSDTTEAEPIGPVANANSTGASELRDLAASGTSAGSAVFSGPTVTVRAKRSEYVSVPFDAQSERHRQENLRANGMLRVTSDTDNSR
jgi:hypothetical protein